MRTPRTHYLPNGEINLEAERADMLIAFATAQELEMRKAAGENISERKIANAYDDMEYEKDDYLDKKLTEKGKQVNTVLKAKHNDHLQIFATFDKPC